MKNLHEKLIDVIMVTILAAIGLLCIFWVHEFMHWILQ